MKGGVHAILNRRLPVSVQLALYSVPGCVAMQVYMSFDDSGPSSSQTLLRYFPSVQRSPENQSEECNRPDAGSEPHVRSTPKDFYRKTYFEFADAIKGELTRRFDQENYKLYMRAEHF